MMCTFRLYAVGPPRSGYDYSMKPREPHLIGIVVAEGAVFRDTPEGPLNNGATVAAAVRQWRVEAVGSFSGTSSETVSRKFFSHRVLQARWHILHFVTDRS